MNFALTTLWHERSRYLPGVVAVMFSAVLMALQCGLLLGLFSITSIPIDHSRADIWIGPPKVLSVDVGAPIPYSAMYTRIASEPGIAHVESYYQMFCNWTKPNGGTELCIVMGTEMDEGNLGSVNELTPEQRWKLTQPRSIVIDESEFKRLGIDGVGDYGKINDQSVQVVGTVKGMASLAGPYIFCSRETARNLLSFRLKPDQTTYLMATCHDKSKAPAIVKELQEKYKDRNDMSVFTKEDFSYESRKHWLIKTKAGIAIGYAAILGLLVGMVVTYQTLSAATRAAAREYGILIALGIPRWRISMNVVTQSFWVGVTGLVLAAPTVLFLIWIAALLGGIKVLLPDWLVAATAGIILLMAIVSGLISLRAVRSIEPITLLR